MNDDPKDGVVPPDEVKAALDDAMTNAPGMLRAVVKETMRRGEELETSAPPLPSSDTSVAAVPPKPRHFKMQIIMHRIELPNPGMAEELRAQMAPSEIDSVIFADGKWIYIRQRAVAVEEMDDVSKGKEGDGVAESGERSDPDVRDGGSSDSNRGGSPEQGGDGNAPTQGGDSSGGGEPDNSGGGSPPNHP